jgi:hypothetical protein
LGLWGRCRRIRRVRRGILVVLTVQGSSARAPGWVTVFSPVGAVQMTVPSNLDHRWSSWQIEGFRPWQETGSSAILPISSSRKEACYARNEIPNHHFTLGCGWRRVRGIRSDRRTCRRRPARHRLRTRSSSNRRSMQRPRHQCEQCPCASRWHGRPWDGRRWAWDGRLRRRLPSLTRQ